MLWFLLRGEAASHHGSGGLGNHEPPLSPGLGAHAAQQRLEDSASFGKLQNVGFRYPKNNVFRYSGPITRNSSMFKVQILCNIKQLRSNMFQATVRFVVCFAF